MTVAEFIRKLERLAPDTIILTGRYDPYRGDWDNLHAPNTDITIFVDENLNDVTDRERERDIPAVVIT